MAQNQILNMNYNMPRRYFVYATAANAAVATTLLTDEGLQYASGSSLQTGINEYIVNCTDEQRDKVASKIIGEQLAVYFTADRLQITGSLGAASATIVSPSTVLNGTKATTTGNRTALSAVSVSCKKITIQNSNDSADRVKVGNAAACVFELEIGQSVDIEIDDVASVYIQRAGAVDVTVNYFGA